MGKFEVDLSDINGLMKDLSGLEFSKLAPKMLEGAAPIVEDNIKRRAEAHRESGDMAASIKTKKAAWRNGGYHISVRPTGKDKKGVRNMEKMCYLEYGTEKQGATPVMGPAVIESEKPVIDKMQEIFDQETENLKI